MKKLLCILLIYTTSHLSFAGSISVVTSGVSETNDKMGNAVAFFQSGNTYTSGMVIGVRGEDNGAGAIMYYKYEDSDPIYIKYVGNPGDGFGNSVATGFLNDDRYFDIAVGVPWADWGGYSNAGEVYIFYGSSSGPNWSNPEIIRDTSYPQSHARFGYSLAIANVADSRGNDELIVGIPSLDHSGDTDAGAIRLFYKNPFNTGWSRRLIHQGTSGIGGSPENLDKFGWAVDADHETNTIIVGIPFENIGNEIDAGAVQLIKINSNGSISRGKTYHQNSTGVPGASQDHDRFGYSVAIDELGILVGVPGEDITVGSTLKPNAGVAQLIGINPSNLSATSFATHYQSSSAFNGTPENNDDFGHSVDLFWDQVCSPYGSSCPNTLKMLVGAPGEDSDKGVVQYYNGSKIYIHQSYLTGNSRNALDRFGNAVTFWNNDILVGVPNEDLNGRSNTGAAHYLEIDGWGNISNDRFLYQY